MRYLIFLFLLQGCVHEVELSINAISFPEQIREEVQTFVDFTPEGTQIKPLTIRLQGDIIIRHRKMDGAMIRHKKLILIDTTSWLWISGSRKFMIWHEMGHYVTGRDHYNEMLKFNYFGDEQRYPESVMHWRNELPNDESFENPVVLEYYMNELFGL